LESEGGFVSFRVKMGSFYLKLTRIFR